MTATERLLCELIAPPSVNAAFLPRGDIAQAHTRAQWISLKSLERARGLLVNFLLSLP